MALSLFFKKKSSFSSLLDCLLHDNGKNLSSPLTGNKQSNKDENDDFFFKVKRKSYSKWWLPIVIEKMTSTSRVTNVWQLGCYGPHGARI